MYVCFSQKLFLYAHDVGRLFMTSKVPSKRLWPPGLAEIRALDIPFSRLVFYPTVRAEGLRQHGSRLTTTRRCSLRQVCDARTPRLWWSASQLIRDLLKRS